MAITFPLSISELVDLFPVGEHPLVLQNNQNITGLASGEPIAVNRMAELWTGQFTSISMSMDDTQALMAALRSLVGSTHPFYIYDSDFCSPKADLDGSLLGASTPQISTLGVDNKSFAITGLPVGYVLSAGDRFHATYSTSRRFYGEFSETVTANGLGQIASIGVSPHLHPGFLGGVSLTLIKPAIKAKLLGALPLPKKFSGNRRIVSFAFQQTLAKD